MKIHYAKVRFDFFSTRLQIKWRALCTGNGMLKNTYMYNRSCQVYMSGISEMKGILTWELLRNGGIRKKALLCRLFRGIHCWTVFRDRLTGERPSWISWRLVKFHQVPIEVLTYGTVWMDLRARQKHAIRGEWGADKFR